MSGGCPSGSGGDDGSGIVAGDVVINPDNPDVPDSTGGPDVPPPDPSGDQSGNAVVASIDIAPAYGIAPVTMHFSARRSASSYAALSDFAWDFGDGTTGRGAEVYHTFAQPGVYSVLLLVTDAGGNEASAEVLAAALPVFEILTSPGAPEGVAPFELTLTGTTNTGPVSAPGLDGYTLHWDLGDGHTAEGLSVSHVYSQPGSYLVKLSLAVAGALVPLTDVTVQVGTASLEPPIIADAGDNQVVSGGATVTLDGSASRSTLGRPLTFQWAQTGGPTVSLNGPQTARPAFTAPLLAARTDFVFRLTVSDGTTSEQDWTTVTVDADDPGVGLRDGELLVTPEDAFSSTGPQGGPFSPQSKTYTLSNTGEKPLDFTVSRSQNWLLVTPSSGTLAPGAQMTVVVELDDAAKDLGFNSEAYADTLAIENQTSGLGSTLRAVTLHVEAPQPAPARLAVTPEDGLTTSGPQGGPFDPRDRLYTLTNTGGSPLDWVAEHGESWVEVLPSYGKLQPLESVVVTVRLGPPAESLAPGNYADPAVAFKNTTNQLGDTTRPVALAVTSPATVAISGRVATAAGDPVPGVLLSATSGGGSTTSDANGDYTLHEAYGWSGSVLATKAGYTFQPGSRSYANVQAAVTGQNYQANQATFTISGRVTTSGGAGVSGVTLEGLPGNPITDANGYYSVTVNYGFETVIAPTRTGYTFTPATLAVAAVTANTPNQNFTAALRTFTISGKVTLSGGAAVSGVTVTGLPGNPMTDAGGNYSATVTYGFAGTATPSKAGHVFTPVSRSYSSVTANQTSQNYTATVLSYAISGKVVDSAGSALANVTLSGLPGNPVSDVVGNYSAIVQYGFSGTVTPMLTGHTFSPATRTYSNVTGHQSNQNYTGTPQALTISGRVAVSGGGAVAGVTMSGLPGNPVTDASGNYFASVDAGFTGTVTPTKAGYSFTPASYTYTNLTTSQTGKDHTAAQVTLTIAGRVTNSGGTGISGVTIGGLPGNPVTDASGNYTATVSYGFSGTATPSKTGYTFTPVSRSYSNITASQASQNYTAALLTYTISGRVTNSGGTGISGVAIGGLPGSPVTDASGNYAATVSYGFSGTATPNRAGYTFSPVSRSYSNVTANQTGQNYTATVLTYTVSGRVTDSGGTGLTGVTIGGLPGSPVTNATGNYSATVTYGFSGTATPSLTGYAFTPTSRAYSNVTANQANQNYTAVAVTYTISGRVIDSGGTGVSGVTLAGLPGNPVTDATGNYSATVGAGFSATVTPMKSGHAFNPPSKTYSNVAANQTAQDYTATAGVLAMTTASRTSGVAPLGVFFDTIDTPAPSWTSSVIQPRGFADHPVTITGVRITRVNALNPLGNGTLSYTAGTKTLRWAAPGDALGTPVSVEAGGSADLVSGNGQATLHVWVKPTELPATNGSETITIVSGGLNADWASYHYEWDFGDPAPDGTPNNDPRWYWEHGAKKSDGSWFAKNKAFGWNAAHVYEDAGHYTVTLKVIDDVGTEYTYTQTIEVLAEPAGGWITYHFAANGDDVNGDGSEGSPFRSFAKAMTLLGPNVRVLFKRGDTFEVTTTGSRSTNGPSMLAAYGSGSRPRFALVADSGFIGGGNMHDTRFIDLWIDGDYPNVAAPGYAFGWIGNDSLCLRTRVQDANAAFHLEWRGRNIIQECEAINSRKVSYWLSANPQVAILGSTATDLNEEAFLRIYTTKAVVSNSYFGPAPIKYNIRFMSADAAGKEGRWYICSANYFDRHGVTSNSDSNTTMVSHLLVTSNHFSGGLPNNYTPLFFLGTHYLTVVNNRVSSPVSGAAISLGRGYLAYDWNHHVSRVLHNSAYAAAADSYCWARGIGIPDDVPPKSTLIHVMNNAVASPATSAASTIAIGIPASGGPNLQADHNCWHFPNISSPFRYDGAATNWSSWQSNGLDVNSLADSPQWFNAAGDDFRLGALSPLISSGSSMTLPWCRVDADGSRRPTAGPAIGALEP